MLDHIKGKVENRRSSKTLTDRSCNHDGIPEYSSRLMVEFSSDGIFIIQNNRIKLPNPAMETITGYTEEELSSLSFDELIHPGDRELVREKQKMRLSAGKVGSTYAFHLIHKSGRLIWVEVNAVLIQFKGKPAVFNLVRDLTQLKNLENQLHQTQKLEAIGTLAGGIAHDFNNILAAIIGFSDLGIRHTSQDSNHHFNYNQILKAGKRAKDLIRQILVFSRDNKEEKKPLLFSSIMKESLKLLRATLPATIKIKRGVKDESAKVLADPTHMHQVLMNLCSNAAHAMRERGGVLEIDMDSVDIKRGGNADYPDLEPGIYLKITISDTGHGIDSSHLDRIFEPFFTTKDQGEGTGLGLAMVQGIVYDHQGRIFVKSSLGEGTCFELFFPRIEEDVQGEEYNHPSISSGNGRILLVDDEKALVAVGKAILERLGYEVTTSTDANEAFDLFQKRSAEFDLVITDQTMPDMTGAELSKKIMQVRPGIPVILCSGFSDTMTEEKARSMGIQSYLMKPYDTQQISKTIHQVIESTSS